MQKIFQLIGKFPNFLVDEYRTRDVHHIELIEAPRRFLSVLTLCGFRSNWGFQHGGFHTFDDLPADVCPRCKRNLNKILKLWRKKQMQTCDNINILLKSANFHDGIVCRVVNGKSFGFDEIETNIIFDDSRRPAAPLLNIGFGGAAIMKAHDFIKNPSNGHHKSPTARNFDAKKYRLSVWGEHISETKQALLLKVPSNIPNHVSHEVWFPKSSLIKDFEIDDKSAAYLIETWLIKKNHIAAMNDEDARIARHSRKVWVASVNEKIRGQI